MKQRHRRPQCWKGLWKPAGFQTPSHRGRRAEGNRLSQPKDPELVRSKAGLRTRLPGSQSNTRILYMYIKTMFLRCCVPPAEPKAFLEESFLFLRSWFHFTSWNRQTQGNLQKQDPAVISPSTGQHEPSAQGTRCDLGPPPSLEVL